MRQRVYVSAMATINALGYDAEQMWEAMVSGQCGIKPVKHFDTSWLPVHVAAEIQSFDQLPRIARQEAEQLHPAGRMTLSCMRAALQQADLLRPNGTCRISNLPVIMGTTQSDMQGWLQSVELNADQQMGLADKNNLITDNLAYGLLDQVMAGCGLSGFQTLISNTCASSGYALAVAMDHIRQGYADSVLCVGVDVTSIGLYTAFCSLRSLDPERCRPFAQTRQGLSLGDGCGVMLLDSEASLARRQKKPLAECIDYGWSNDAYHLVSPHPAGQGIEQALRQLFKKAQCSTTLVDAVVAHGTGTPANDSIEAHAYHRVFGDHHPPVVAPKSSLGHTMGAASIIEAIVAVKSLQHQLLPPTVGVSQVDPNCPINLVTERPRSMAIKHILTTSSGFGGSNNCLLLARVEH